MLATQSLGDAVREVLSSCSLPLDYVDTMLQVPGGASVSQSQHFSQSIQSTILERFYGFSGHDVPRIRVHRMARDTLRSEVLTIKSSSYRSVY